MKSRIPHILIIRFSSIGDIVQALSAAQALREKLGNCEIHWLVRSDLAELPRLSPAVDKVWAFDRSTGLKGLLSMAATLQKQKYDYIYDAHGSLRSRIVCTFVKSPRFIRRPKYRFKRFLQFQLGVKAGPVSASGQSTYLEPLKPWGISVQPHSPSAGISAEQVKAVRARFQVPESYIVLVPSAAWPKKRWPEKHWKDLIQKLNSIQLVLLGGREDTFISELVGLNDNHVLNLAGRLSLLESCQIVAGAQSVISADTGLLHVADQLGVSAIALIGPTAYGYPGRSTSHVLEVELSCKPCSKDGRGSCHNAVFQKCMLDITPAQVENKLKDIQPRP